MIGPGTGVRVYLACGATDMRKGIAGLAALAQDQLRQKPASGAVFAFRGRKGDRLKLLYWDGQGFCLYYKVLERGRFPWPKAEDGVARLTSARDRRCCGRASTGGGRTGARRRLVWGDLSGWIALFSWRSRVTGGNFRHVCRRRNPARRSCASEGDDRRTAGRERQDVGDHSRP